MNRIIALLTILTLSTLVLIGRPNVVVVFIDDMG